MLLIDEKTIRAARTSEQDLRQDIAVLLYEKCTLSLARAARFASMDRIAFQHLLASRGKTVNFESADLLHDVAVLEKKLAR
ncbi:MAG TPA: UPF0175 family protein [bacterium]|nr:UPF0175 family protein [bacterium]